MPPCPCPSQKPCTEGPESEKSTSRPPCTQCVSGTFSVTACDSPQPSRAIPRDSISRVQCGKTQQEPPADVTQDLPEFCRHSRSQCSILITPQEVTEPSSEDRGDPAPQAPAPPHAGSFGAFRRALCSACFRCFHPHPSGSAAETSTALTPLRFAGVQDPAPCTPACPFFSFACFSPRTCTQEERLRCRTQAAPDKPSTPSATAGRREHGTSAPDCGCQEAETNWERWDPQQHPPPPSPSPRFIRTVGDKRPSCFPNEKSRRF